MVSKSVSAFVDFVNQSPSPFHSTHQAIARLLQAGFQPLSEAEAWQGKLVPGGKYLVSRNQSAVLAFAVGGQYSPARGAFSIIGAHTDSPSLRIKPVSRLESAGFLEVGCETYGGGLWSTWFDRDLGLAGRVIVRESDTSFKSRLVLVNKPILRVPTLAIHFDRTAGNEFSFNKETQLCRPVLATAARAALEKTDGVVEQKDGKTPKHHAVLLQLLAKELGVQIDQICDFDLCLFDTQGANVGGLLDEFVFGQRFDNLCSAWLAHEALIQSLDTLDKDPNVRIAALFDNEEVGSESRAGAASDFLDSVMRRIAPGENAAPAIQRSFLVSADVTHGVHPNYVDKYEQNHHPLLGAGPAIKCNANQRYSTTAESMFLFKEIARRNHVDVQEFVVRQDAPCGSTIGPALSTRTGIRTVDMGVALISMHSIREMIGADDMDKTLELFKGFYSDLPAVDKCFSME